MLVAQGLPASESEFSSSWREFLSRVQPSRPRRLSIVLATTGTKPSRLIGAARCRSRVRQQADTCARRVAGLSFPYGVTTAKFVARRLRHSQFCRRVRSRRVRLGQRRTSRRSPSCSPSSRPHPAARPLGLRESAGRAKRECRARVGQARVGRAVLDRWIVSRASTAEACTAEASTRVGPATTVASAFLVVWCTQDDCVQCGTPHNIVGV